MPQPLVSAIVFCYNQARFAVECLEGIKAQNYPNLELIVHDDASRDNSIAVIKAWLADNFIPCIFLQQKTNQGLCRSINHALTFASGKYVSAVAADDVWLPGKLLTQVEIMERLPDKVGVLYSDAIQIDETGRLLPQKFIEAQRHFDAMPEGDIHLALWEGNFIPAMTTLVRRECYRKAGTFDETLFYEDWDMWLRISRSYEFVYSPRVSAKYRHVSTSMVRSQWIRMLDSSFKMCLKHLTQTDLSPEARRLALARLYNDVIAATRRMTPEYKHHFFQAIRLALTDKTAFALLGQVLGRKILSRF